MPLLGEAPITLYMEKKPKANGGSGNSNAKPPLKKRKIDASGRNKDTMREHKPSVSRTPTILTFFDSSKTAAGTGAASGSQTPGQITPKILRKRTKGVESSHMQLQTPPLTNEASSRQYRLAYLPTVIPEPSCSNGSEKSTGRSRSTFYPTPTTIPRQIWDSCSSNFPHNQETPCKRTIGQSTFSSGSSDPLFQDVPSSQTQPLVIKKANSPLKLHSTPQERVGHLSTPPDDVHFLVESSQSQPPLYVSEQTAKDLVVMSKDSHGYGIDPASSECIPSSQSQEIELKIPDITWNQNGFTLEHKKTIPHALITKTAGKPAIYRTSSDELFPVPIQYGVLDDIFNPENSPLGLEQDTHTPRLLQEGAEDSCTESDSQYEEFVEQLRVTSKSTGKYVEEPPTISDSDSRCDMPCTASSGHCNHTPQNSRILSPIKCKPISSSQDSGYEASQGEDFNDECHFKDSMSQPADASQESLLQSSPVDLLAFFGNTQDSYPPDFPMSLR